MADSPDVRIGTAEREQALARLSDHFAEGRLSVGEFDERSATIAAAVTRADLAPVFVDLPATVPQQPPPERSEAPAAPPARRGNEIAGVVTGLAVLIALVLFFTTHTWLWLLLIPAAGIVTRGMYGGGRPRQRRLERRQRRRGRP
ncbi:MAG: DUF1707 domain-containing protein [Nocardia sp.]|nr:DUF1707 domain-containing protein [Nocardia sp.]